MATKYIPDELIAEIVNNGDDVQSFIREAIEEKLDLTKADKESKLGGRKKYNG